MALVGFLGLGCLDSPAGESIPLDAPLAALLRAAHVEPLSEPAPPSTAMLALGRVLMFDKILSGNRDISCGTCHAPSYHSTDKLALAIGTGGLHVGPFRSLARGRFISRNTAELYGRGLSQWTRFFWDGRVALEGSGFVTPAGAALPADVSSLLAVQAMFPVLNRDEMRGYPGDTDATGRPNELAVYADQDFSGAWEGLAQRLRAIPEYMTLFRAAFPGVDSANLGFQHAAIAIAAFETAAFTHFGSPFDRYLAGDLLALSDSAKRGALLFYGRARCSTCHSGSLLTDQQFHNIGIPQIGPGRGSVSPLDVGRAGETGRPDDRFRFRTPALRNVGLTGPWMHDGAYTTLVAAVRHYRNARASLLHYDPSQLDPRIQPMVHSDAATNAAILNTLDPIVASPLELSDAEVADLMTFLVALTDPTALDQVRVMPSRVPSGLPVFQ